MILIDYSPIIISSLMVHLKKLPKGETVDESTLRIMTLDSLRATIFPFKKNYGEVVLACDSRKSWRRDIFPFYKANRKIIQDASGLDWPSIFQSLDLIKSELKEFLPYKMIEVEACEADDIIAVLTKLKSSSENVVIISNDKDFLQLQKYPNVKQWRKYDEKYIKSDNPTAFLKEQIIRGDATDGVPNFLSPDDCLVLKQRQKSINSKALANWVNQTPDEICENENQRRWYNRNELMINLDKISPNYVSAIIDTYNNTITGNRAKMLNYFLNKRMKNLIGSLGDF